MTNEQIAGRRITIMLPDELHKKIKRLQAKYIPEFEHAVSFSNVISAVAELGFEANSTDIKKLIKKRIG